MTQHPWWYIARGCGLVAWIVLFASMLAGVTLRYRRTRSAVAMLDLHRLLAILAVLLVAVHMAALLADGFVGYGFQQLLLPLRSVWRPGPVAWGVVAAYLLVIVEGSSLLARHISRTRWRRLHTMSYPCFAAASLHFATAGSDVARWVPVPVTAVVTAMILIACFWGAARSEREFGPDRSWDL